MITRISKYHQGAEALSLNNRKGSESVTGPMQQHEKMLVMKKHSI